MTPRDLVCARCWRDFFNTEAFEKCCTYDHFGNVHEQRSVEAVAATSEIRDADCTWCAYIRSFIRDSWMPEDRVTTNLSPSLIGSCTPRGGNIFYLDISCHSPRGKWIGGSALFLHAWTAADDNASAYVTARPWRTDVNSEAATVQLRTWSDECMGHECCSPSHREASLPARVIEINPPGRRHPRLLESRNLRGVYATLSYCWGETPFRTLTWSNYGKFTEELDVRTLPCTIRHAISTTRNLSIPYLWIDALCIIQDSEEDKIREIAVMKDIYASSALTIVAASAKSVFEGFLHPRVHSEPSHTIPVRIRPGVYGTMSVNELDAASYDERLEPLAKRAWTMQEQLLAQRTLTFTTHTMMWRCRAGTRNFGDSLYFPHDLDAGYNDNDDKYSLNLHSLLLSEEEARSQRDKALSCWLRIVTAYSLRVASLERDKLNAIAGIASHPSFSRVLGPGYFAGLWQYELARQLTWRASRWHRTLPENDTCIIHRPTRYRAPSWSWASLEGGVIRFNFSFDDEDATVPDIICDIIDCSTAPISPELNPFGQVLSARLRLKAAVRRAWFNPSTHNIFLLSVSTSSESRIIVPHNEELISFDEASTRHIDEFLARHPDVDLDEDPEATYGTDYRNMCGTYDDTENHDPVIVLCVAINLSRERDDRVEGLLLLPSEVEGDDNMFKRIGFFERGRNEDFLKETKTEISVI
ncbi:uncharacterized protein Z519_09750 [Cladophialophora bantiana CBS 173.52]|uniref:Heterokaryon incompatibility domain-containing protein n=1 Tax=Cladophialophora bantiana (strain ATCC 10958 / CBS 173.52 / CDC B-1940 / NIH 8579) TaxID=1442370 RepID=A0A0D2HYE6_CLAB1|nr:uncharacterized protein Z519_09750 [Cladophialophora bantiana CBS 173.52]KIW89594.1 hypothetical protein Z519_09750 [Cladophialophora bantiana CBS 173.52]